MEGVTIGTATLILGDCLDVLPTLSDIGAVVSDPPYGMNWNTKSTRYSGGSGQQRAKRGVSGRADWGGTVGDDKPFDPTPWLTFPQVILWGSNHYAARLPVGTTLVWIKRNDPAFGSFLSDAEMAWQKGGHGVYCRRDLSLNATTRTRSHPNEKPVGLMEWCVSRTKGTVLDPYMGSGTTGVACLNTGRRFIGIEKNPDHFKTACRRIAESPDGWKVA
jgi:site-specific DNA-methyltransferase (adenine-specific)